MTWAAAIEKSTNLSELEAIVEKGKDTFVEVGMALMRIRDAKLYKTTHDSWEKYCKDRWKWGRNYADKLARAAAVSADLIELGTMVPNERVARQLSLVPEADRKLVLADATALAGGTPTAAQVREAIELRADGKAKSPSIQDMRTPRWFFDALQAAVSMKFKLDAYASPHNAMCPVFYTIEDDGNVKPWVDETFANPRFKKADKAGMYLCLKQAVAMQDLGLRSCVVGPVGCSQDWFHELAIQGTTLAPDCRINWDEPDGEPTDGADRDTNAFVFGKGWKNQNWKKGEFRVRQLKIKHLAPAPRVVERKYIPMGPEE